VLGAICSDHSRTNGRQAGAFAESEPGSSGLETLLPLTLRLVDEKL